MTDARNDRWVWGMVEQLFDYFKDVPAPVQLGKIGEEYGEVWEAYINMMGHNPRKNPATWCPVDVCQELVDVIISALVALHHFSGDPRDMFETSCEKYEARLAKAGYPKVR